MEFEIAVDVGGTFTDLILRDGSGRLHAAKSPTTPDDIVDGVLVAVGKVAEMIVSDRETVLSRCGRFAFGTTAATNAVLESKAAKSGLICTRGHRDILLIREGGKEDTYNINVDYPKPYVPRRLTFEVSERIDAEGGIAMPLNDDEARDAIAELCKAGVEAIAVALLWSITNPAHERRIGELIEEVAPGLPYSLSHLVSPSVREYRRTSATALDASLKPIIDNAIRGLSGKLKAAGFTGTLTLVTSSGGKTSPEDVIAKPVSLCFSGPSAAPESGRRFAELEQTSNGNVITVDMGGTSFDVSIVTDWQISMHRDGVIAGHSFGVPSVEVLTIGAGGGSLARVDAGGLIHTGPESAGSRPGPACYGRGGRRATVTDANLIRGFLNPESFAGGTMRLDMAAAEAALYRDVAAPLGLDLDKAAGLVCVTCDQAMVGAIEDITVRRGIDPRDYIMVAGGAAAGLHAVTMARELDIKEVIVPRFAGVLSAFGILTGDIKNVFGLSTFTSSMRFDAEAINIGIEQLRRQGKSYLDRMRVAADDRLLEFTAEARYRGQIWQLTLPLSGRHYASAEDVAALVEDFHRLHERIYSVRSDEDPVEILELNLQAVGRLPDIVLPRLQEAGEPPQPAAFRSAYFRELGRIEKTPVYAGGSLSPGHAIEGPALIEEPLTSIVVPPGATAEISPHGNYRIRVGP